jgi:hypothetical protein
VLSRFAFNFNLRHYSKVPLTPLVRLTFWRCFLDEAQIRPAWQILPATLLTRTLKPGCSRHMASFDVASNTCPARCTAPHCRPSFLELHGIL